MSTIKEETTTATTSKTSEEIKTEKTVTPTSDNNINAAEMKPKSTTLKPTAKEFVPSFIKSSPQTNTNNTLSNSNNTNNNNSGNGSVDSNNRKKHNNSRNFNNNPNNNNNNQMNYNNTAAIYQQQMLFQQQQQQYFYYLSQQGMMPPTMNMTPQQGYVQYGQGYDAMQYQQQFMGYPASYMASTGMAFPNGTMAANQQVEPAPPLPTENNESEDSTAAPKTAPLLPSDSVEQTPVADGLPPDSLTLTTENNPVPDPAPVEAENVPAKNNTVVETQKYLPPGLKEPIVGSTNNPGGLTIETPKPQKPTNSPVGFPNNQEDSSQKPVGSKKRVFSKNQLLELYSADVLMPKDLMESYPLSSSGAGSSNNGSRGKRDIIYVNTALIQKDNQWGTEREPIGFFLSSERGKQLLMSPNQGGNSGNYSPRDDNGRNSRTNSGFDRSASNHSLSRHASRDDFGNNGRFSRQNTPSLDNNSAPTPRRQKDSPAPEYKSIFQTDPNDPEVIMRKANFILNKLSVTNFEKLAMEFLTLAKESLLKRSLLKRAVEMIVTKAQMEEHFCFMYAHLCRFMTDDWTESIPADFQDMEDVGSAETEENENEEEGEENKDPKTKDLGGVFRELLLERCQLEFDRDRNKDLQTILEDPELTPDERLEKEILLKKRFTGHMRFIGEIYVKDLVKAKIMNSCLEELMSGNQEEAEMVCMCKLFQTIGAKLDQYYYDKQKKSKTKSSKMGVAKSKRINDHFQKILEISNNHESSRVRFMLKDLIEMRDNDWVARREEEKVVDLNEARNPGSTANSIFNPKREQPSPNPEPQVIDEWELVGSTKKGKNSAPLSNPVPPANPVQSGKNSKNNKSGLASTGKNKSSSSLNRANSSKNLKNSVKPTTSNSNTNISSLDESNKPTTEVKKPEKTDKTPPLGHTVDSKTHEKYSELTKKIRVSLDEFYVNEDISEPILTFQEIQPKIGLMPEIFKYFLMDSLERKQARDRVLFVDLVLKLTSTNNSENTPFLSKSTVKEGILLFLHELDEYVIDVPKAGLYAAEIYANLIAMNLLELSLLNNLPEENDFSISSRVGEFIGQILQSLKSFKDTEFAKNEIQSSGIKISDFVRSAPKQTQEEALTEFTQKYNLTGIIN